MQKNRYLWMALLIAIMSLATFGKSITVTVPAGSEHWALGSTVTIHWSVSDVSGNVGISLIRRNGGLVGIIQARIEANAGSFSWPVGELTDGTAETGDNYRIRVRALQSGTTGQSEVFSITPAVPLPQPSLRMNTPLGGNYTLGESQVISWQFAVLSNTTRVKIELYDHGVSNFVGAIASNYAIGTSGTGSFPWTIGNYIGGTAPAGSGYTIKVSTLDNSVHAFSAPAFSLVAPAPPPPPAASIEVSSPLAPLTITHNFTINWSARGVSGNLSIGLLKESGGTCALATGVEPGVTNGHFVWVVGQLTDPATPFPSVAGERFRIQIVSRGTGRMVIGESRWFEITLPTLRVTEPHRNDDVSRDDNQTIRWVGPEIQGGVHIDAYYRYLRGGSAIKYTRLFTGVSNLDHRDWIVFPNTGGSEAELDPPPTHSHGDDDVRWFIRVISARCPWIFADGGEFTLYQGRLF